MSAFKALFGGGRKLPGDQTRDILGRHLNADFVVFPLAEQRSSAEAVREVGRRLGVPLPPEVIAHLSGEFPGIYVEAKEGAWPRPKLYDVGPMWSFLYGVQTFTAAAQSEQWMRMETVARQLRDETGVRMAPVLKVVGDANVYCVEATGQLVQFDHETGELSPVGLGFFALLDREIGELRKRTERKKEAAGKPDS